MSVRKKRDRPVGVDVLAERFASACDLWTGLPLEGEELTDWNLHQEELREATRKRKLIQLRGGTVLDEEGGDET